MSYLRKVFHCSILALVAVAFLGTARSVHAADDLGKVLARLDASSEKFKSAQAEIAWDNVQMLPIKDVDSQTGNVVFERKNGKLQMSLHLKTENGKPHEKQMVYAGGVFKLYEPGIKQLQVFKAGDKQAQYEMFLTVGFGGSGKDLDKNWQVSLVGTEPVEGVQAAKLQLIPRDAKLLESTTKVLLWIDMDKGVAVKQQSFSSDGNYRTVTYRGIKLNSAVTTDAFDIKVPSGTQTVSH